MEMFYLLYGYGAWNLNELPFVYAVLFLKLNSYGISFKRNVICGREEATSKNTLLTGPKAQV